MTLTASLASCYQRLSFGDTPDAVVVTRITQFVNDTVREILSDKTIGKLRRKVVPFVTVASLQTCVLPQAVSNVYAVVDRTNRRKLAEVTTDWIRRRDPGLSFSSAIPQMYAIRSYAAPIARDPAASGQLTMASTAAGDTGNVYVEVMTVQGYTRLVGPIALTGTTPVNIGPADSLIVSDFYLAAVQTGEVTLLDASSNELGRIGIGRLRSRYTQLEIYPFPSSAVTLYADVDLEITDLVNGTDESLIPDEFGEAIVHGVRKREYEKRERWDSAGEARGEQRAVISRLRHHVATVTAKSDRSPDAFSQLGPYFPAGS